MEKHVFPYFYKLFTEKLYKDVIKLLSYFMLQKKVLSCALLCLLLLSFPSAGASTISWGARVETVSNGVVAALPAVKKSRTGICHGKGTRYYNQTKYYTSYSTIKACLKSGGRMPKQ